jgi:hypothetical protein
MVTLTAEWLQVHILHTVLYRPITNAPDYSSNNPLELDQCFKDLRKKSRTNSMVL